MFSLTFQRVSASSHFSQHVLMSFQLVKRLGFDGYSGWSDQRWHVSAFLDVCSYWLPSERSVRRADDVLNVSYFPWCWTPVVTACDSHETHSLIPLILSEVGTHLSSGAKNSYDSSTSLSFPSFCGSSISWYLSVVYRRRRLSIFLPVVAARFIGSMHSPLLCRSFLRTMSIGRIPPFWRCVFLRVVRRLGMLIGNEESHGSDVHFMLSGTDEIFGHTVWLSDPR